MKRSLTCDSCGHRWVPIDPRMVKQSLVAAKVNRRGPYCAVCRPILEAMQAATARKLFRVRGQLRKVLQSL